MAAVLRWNEVAPRVRLSAVSLPVVLVTTLLYALGLIDSLAIVGHVALVLYLLAEWPRLPRTSQALLWVAVAAAVLLPVLVTEPLPVLRQAFDRAAYYATFMTALAFLREAAITSPLVRRCGYLILNQPPAKRYLTLSGGAALFGIILNIGSLNLLGVMTMRGNTLRAAGGNPDIQRTRRRRMTQALLRGFGLTPLVSPFSITLVVVLSNIPGLQWYQVLPLGYLLAGLLLWFGWWFDRRTAPKHLAGLAPALDRQVRWWPLIQFVALVLAIVSVAVALELLLTIPLVLAILLTAPLAGLTWLAVQRDRHGPVRALRYASVRLGRRAVHLFPSLRSEVGILGGAGFVGVLLSAMLPPQLVANALDVLHLTGPLIAVLMLAIVLLASHVGINPIISVSLLASALPDPASLGLAPAVLGAAFMAAWALAVSSSPMTASVLLLARLAEVSPNTIGYRWNGIYTAGGFLLLASALFGLGYLL